MASRSLQRLTGLSVRRLSLAGLIGATAFGLGLQQNSAQGQTTYTWSSLTGGSMQTAANWSGAAVPLSVADDVLDFSTLNITADATVTMDGNFTAGSILFGDVTTASNNWILNPGTPSTSTLTLSATTGAPTFTVSNTRTATFNVPVNIVGGNLTKTGDGTAILNGAVMGWTADMVNSVTAGTLAFGTGSGVVFDFGTVSKTAGGGTVVFNSVTPASMTLPASYSVAPAAGGITISPTGTIDGTAGFSKMGVGVFTIGSTNLNVGGTFGTAASGGTLTVSAATSAADNTIFTTASGTTLNLNGATTLGAGVTLGGAGTTNVNGTLAMGTDNVFTNTGTTNINGVLSGTTGLTKNGSGVLVLANAANTFTGATMVNAGTLQITNGTSNNTYLTASALANSSITVASGAILDMYRTHNGTNNTINWVLPTTNLLNGGTIRFRAGNGTDTHQSAVALNVPETGTVTIQNSGGGYTNTVTLSGPITGGATINYVAGNAGSSTGATRSLTLTSPASTFTGNWALDYTQSPDDFSVLISGAVGALGTGNVSLGNRAALTSSVAGGIDSVTGVTLNQATSTLNTGAGWTNPAGVLTLNNGTVNIGSSATSYGTISIASITQAGGTINFDIGSTGNDKILLSGDYTITNANYNVNFTGIPQTGEAVLVTANNITSQATVNFTGLTGSRYSAQVQQDATKISITTTGGLTAPLVWKGNQSAYWDTATPNFDNAGTPDTFYTYDNVIFNDTATEFSPYLPAAVTPSVATFNNTNTYILYGSGGIAGSASLVKNGTGTVALQTTNTFAGPTTINAGTLELDQDAGTLSGTSVISIGAAGTFKISKDTASITVPAALLSGTGTVVLDPTSNGNNGTTVLQATFTGNNTNFTGLLKLSPTYGTFRTLNTTTQANLGNVTIDVDAGAQLYTTGAITSNITITGAGANETTPGGTVTANLAALGFNYPSGIGAIRLTGTANIYSGTITLDGHAKIDAYSTTGTISGNITNTTSDDILVVGGGGSSQTVILTGNNLGLEKIWVNSGGTSGTAALQIGSYGTSGTLGTGDVILHADAAKTAVLNITRTDGYTLAANQKILADAALTADYARANMYVNSTGTGLVLNSGNVIDLSDGTTGGTIEVGNNAAGTGAALVINSGATIETGNLYIGNATGVSGSVTQTGGSVTAVSQIRVGHWGTETGTYTMSGGALNVGLASPAASPSGSGEQVGGIYVGIDGRGIFNQSGGTVSTNWVVLDNRGDSGAGANMDTGIDQYNLSGGLLKIRSTWGIIQRNTTAEFKMSGGTIQVDNTGTGTGTGANLTIPLATTMYITGTTATLDTNGVDNRFALSRNVNGPGTLNVIGGGTLMYSPGTGANTISAVLAGTFNATKDGTGTTTIASASTYTGTTTITAGTLNVTGSLANSDVNLGAGILGGEGSIKSLTSTSGGTIGFDSNTAGALTVNGALVATGVTNIDFAVIPTAPGIFTVLNYGSQDGSVTAANFALANAAQYRPSASITVNPTNVIVDPSIKILTWAGTTANWEIGGTENDWVDTGSNSENFYRNDTVTFNDTATANTAITLLGQIAPAKVTVNSSTNAYTLTSSTGNQLTGIMTLTKAGTSTLTMAGVANTYTGGTTISNGTINVRAAGVLGTGTVTLTDASTGSNNVALYLDSAASPNNTRTSFATPIVVANNGTGTVTLGSRSTVTGTGDNNQFTNITLMRDVIFDSNAADRTDYENISGTGNIRVTGTGRSVFITNNTYVGNLTIATTGAGTVQLGTASAATNNIPDTSNVTIESGARLNLSYSSGSETIAGLFGAGTLGNNSGTSNLLIVGNGDTSGNFTGNILGNVQFNKSGAGTQILAGTNTNTGATTVSGGKLLIDGNSAGMTGAVAVSSTSTLGGVGTIGGVTTFASGSFVAPGTIAPGSATGTLTLANGANLSAGGTYQWQLGALSTLSGFDSITVSAGNLTLGGTSALTLDFSLLSGTDPNSSDAFWGTAHSWKIIDLTGAAANVGSASLNSITNSMYTSGNFTTTVGTGGDAGDIFLVFTPAGPPAWIGVNGANWTAATSWGGSVPNSNTAEAKFVTTGGTTAVLDANQTVNKLTFDATAPHTISGASTLTLAGTTPVISTAGTNTATQTVAVNLDLAAGTAINVQGGTLELNSPANAVLGAGVTATVASGATLSLGGTGNALSNGGSTHANVANSGTLAATTPGKRVGNIDGTGTTTVTAANATLTANHVRQSTVNIGAGNTVTIANNGTDTATSVVTSLNINATGKLDLNDNDLIVKNGNLTTLTAQLATGLDINGNYGGGPGITSSAFASNMDFNTVLGIAANSDLGYMSFSGQAVGNNDVLIKYTYYGDADLSGSVDTSTDFDLYITGLTSGGSLGGWLFGDFDYSGTVDSSTDFDLYITGLTSQGSPLLTAGGGGGNLVQAVPEPSTFVLGGLALLGFAGVGLRRRRLAT